MRSVAVALAAVVVGCARVPFQVVNPYTPPPGEYQEGYSAGCPSGQVAAGHPYRSFTKDVDRYSNDARYRQGWDDGFSVCKGQYEAIGNALRR
jgi:hypothetical protein